MINFDIFPYHTDNLESLIGCNILTQNPNLSIHEIQACYSILQLSQLILKIINHMTEFALESA